MDTRTAQTAAATRSLTRAMRLRGKARDEAMRRHFDEFVTPILGQRVCSRHRGVQARLEAV